MNCDRGSGRAIAPQNLFQSAELVGRLDEPAKAFGPGRQGLTGTRRAEEIGVGIGRPHRPITAAGADAEGIRKSIGEDGLELDALAAAGFRRDGVGQVKLMDRLTLTADAAYLPYVAFARLVPNSRLNTATENLCMEHNPPPSPARAVNHDGWKCIRKTER
ncbi:MAG TPA: hypothetical protein VN065_15015 [Bradyrhizobium sp.]|nr:hypothetical protein [Bradyrhizobium sp.]